MRLGRLLIPLIVLAVPSLYAAEPVGLAADAQLTHGAADVSFAETVRYHARGKQIRNLCRAEIDVIGCTDFPAERIVCKCERRGDHWVLDAQAFIEAQVHLADRRAYNRVLNHERMHLVDLETELRAHLETLVAQQFDAPLGCETLATVVSSPSYVRAVMNRLRRASNEKYHCQKPGSAVEAHDEAVLVALAH